MSNFVGIALVAGLLAAWAAVGLIAAYLTGYAIDGGSDHLTQDTFAGVIGGLGGGAVAWLLEAPAAAVLGVAARLLGTGATAVLGSIIAAFLGAWTLVIVARQAALRRPI
jgi:hypothetical protein